MPRVIVIGGGVTGLSAAWWLTERSRRAGRPLDVTVLEAAPHPGGNVRTVLDDGFLVEAGPNAWLDREPAARALLDDLGLTGRLIESEPSAKNRFVVLRGRLCAVPAAPPSLVTSLALSPLGKLRLLLEPWAGGPPPDTDETVFEFAARRIGREAAESLVDAAVSGISAGDSRRLSVRAAFPLMVEMEAQHGSLIRAMIARSKVAGPTRLVTLDRGLGLLVDTLAARLGDRLHLGAPVTTLRRDARGWAVRTADGAAHAADRVVLAVPAWHAARLVESLAPDLATELDTIPAAGLAVVALAFRAGDLARPLDGYGHLMTRRENAATLGVVWESSLFAGRAPAGTVLLRAMVGGVRTPGCADMDPPALIARALAEMTPLLGVRGAPLRTWVFRWPRAIPQYERGHLARMERVRAAAAALPGLELCGTSYEGIAFSAAIASADRLARRQLEAQEAAV